MKQISTTKGVIILVSFALLVVVLAGLVGTGKFGGTNRPPEQERINYNPKPHNPDQPDIPADAQLVPPTTEAAAPPAAPATSAGNGTYLVGTDLQAGRYKTGGNTASGCYWSRSKDDSGELRSIIANENFDGPAYVTVNAGEFVKFSGGCTWELQP